MPFYINNIFLRIFSKAIHVWWQGIYNFHSPNVYIYMLHGIGSDSPFNITYYNFKKFITNLSSQDVKTIGFWNTEKSSGGGIKCCVTFDDVMESVYEYAFTLLKEHNIPFTLFVATDLLDKKGFITTKQLVEMSECELCTIGSHGQTHTACRFHEDTFENELIQSKKILENIIKKEINYYAFPYGAVKACSRKCINMVKKCKLYKNSFGTISSGFNSNKILNPFFIP